MSVCVCGGEQNAIKLAENVFDSFNDHDVNERRQTNME